MKGRDRGFSYLGLLFLVAMLSLASAAASVVWHVAALRERERELVFVGLQYRKAIEQYQRRAVDPAQRFPRQLEDLLRDPRVPQTVRDLRRLYPDPMTGSQAWGLLKAPDGSVIGVHSLSGRTPVWRTAGPPGMSFESARSHRDWWFVAPSAVLLARQVAGSEAGALRPSDRASAPAAETAPSTVEESASPPAFERPPTQSDYRTRGAEACRRIAAADQAVCAQQGTLFGTQAQRDCQDSATARAAACPFVDAGPLPPLYFRNQ